MVKGVPQRIYRCPDCGYITEYRWILARHLYNIHDYYKRDAAEAAIKNVYLLSPISFRKRDLLRRYDNED
jgi:hypothetical protein